MIKTKNKFISILMSMLMVITILMPIIGLKASAYTTKSWNEIQPKLKAWNGQGTYLTWGYSPYTCTGAVRKALIDAYGFTKYPKAVDKYNRDILNAEGTIVKNNVKAYNSDGTPNKEVWSGVQPGDIGIAFNANGKGVHTFIVYSGNSLDSVSLWHSIISNKVDGVTIESASHWLKHPGSKKPTTITFWRVIKSNGYAKLKKVTANNKHLTDGCSQYSLAGAEYGVYSDSGLKNKVGTFTTNANGESNTISLKAGTYYVKELKAPKGYKLDEKTHRTVVTEGKTATVEVTDTPLLDPLYWNIVSKTVKEGADKNLTVEGAEFTVNYYDTLDKNVEGKTPIRTWKFKADKNGFVKWDSSYLLENQPELYKNENGAVKGRIGTYTVEETKAPQGLARDEKILHIQILPNGNDTKQVYYDGKTFNNPKPIENDTAWNQIENPQTVSIKLKKKDIEKEKAQGYGTLKDAEYSVYKLNIFTGQDDFVGKIITDENGNGEIKNLKPGIYKVRETKAPKGYLINPETQRIEALIKEENTANFEYPIESLETPTTTEITKADITTGKELEGAEIVLLNENGEELERWISTKEPHIIKGLEAGKTYKLKETIAPKGYILSETETEFTINNDGKPQRVVMFNEPISIHTTAKDKADGDKFLKPQGKQTIIDTVAYKGLTVGKEYTIKTTLMNKRTNKPIMENGKPVVVESKFVAEKMQGTVDVEIEVDVTKLAGEKVVVFEEVYYDEHGINNTVFWSRCIS